MSESIQPAKNFEIDDWEFWWHKRAFIRTLVVCVLFCAGQLLWIEHIKPPQGHVYERLPTLTGPWWSGHCGNGRTCAQVGNTSVSCGVDGYFPFGGGSRGLCGHLKIPNGEMVTAIRVKTPLANNHYGEYIAIVKSADKVYQSDSDGQIRGQWIYQSRTDAFSSFFTLFIIFYFVQLGIYKSRKGE